VAAGFGAVEAGWLTGAGEVGWAVPPPVGWWEHPAATAASSASPAAHRIRLDVIARPSVRGCEHCCISQPRMWRPGVLA
jgi:hypothetical protein